MGEQVRSVRDKGAPGGGRALSAAHSFGPSGAGYRGAEDTGREGSAHRGCVCLAPPGHLGRARNRIGVRGRCGGGTGSSAATGKRQELPSRCRSSVWSQRHPPIKGCKGLGSLATPCSQALGEVARPGSAKLDCAGSKGSPQNCSVSGEPGKATSPAGE